MKKLIRLKKPCGAAYIDTIFSVFIVMILLSVFVTIIPVFMKKYQLDMAAEDIARMISVSGQTEVADISVLTEEYGVQIDGIDIIIDDNSITSASPSGSAKLIQLSGGFMVMLTSHHTIGVGGIVSDIDIGLSASARGRSEVYWKSLA